MLYRRTKILATIGPASDSPEMLDALMKSGMNACRLNFSHGSHEEHAQRIVNIRSAAAKNRVPVAIVMDLCGPKVRTENATYHIVNGERWTLVPGAGDAAQMRIGIQHPDLHTRLKEGNSILFDDGKLEMLVLSTSDDGVLCEVIEGGVLKPRKSVNTPGVDNGLDVLSEKDKRDLVFGHEQGLDWVAVSFVRDGDDVKRVREYMDAMGWKAPIISKVETPLAIRNLKAITQASDGIMVARGDLGIECPIEDVPILQKKALRLAQTYGKLSIVATQMLESMIGSPRPTRAEASDVANAVFEGAQVVMLSGETASGKYPLEAVRVMHRILDMSEEMEMGQQHEEPRVEGASQQVLGAAMKLQTLTKGPVVVVGCRTASTARLASTFHPNVPVVGLFNEMHEARVAALYYGIIPMVVDEDMLPYDMELVIRDRLMEWDLAEKGDSVPLVVAQPRRSQVLNTIRLIKM
jgi:pyruvate kinase